MIIQENPDKLEVENPQEEIKNSKLPVLVSCLVEDCPLCKILSPIIESVAEKHANKVKVIKVDIDKHKDFSEKYDIQSVPTLLLFSGGELVKTETGFKDTKKLSDIINEVLNTCGDTKNSEINDSSEARLITNTDTQTDITN